MVLPWGDPFYAVIVCDGVSAREVSHYAQDFFASVAVT